MVGKQYIEREKKKKKRRRRERRGGRKGGEKKERDRKRRKEEKEKRKEEGRDVEKERETLWMQVQISGYKIFYFVSLFLIP